MSQQIDDHLTAVPGTPLHRNQRRLGLQFALRRLVITAGLVSLPVGIMAFSRVVLGQSTRRPWRVTPSLPPHIYAAIWLLLFLVRSGTVLFEHRQRIGPWAAWVGRVLAFSGWLMLGWLWPGWPGLLTGAVAGLLWALLLPFLQDPRTGQLYR